MNSQVTRLLIRSLDWFCQSVRTVQEVNGYLLGLRNAGLTDGELAEITVAFCRAETRGEAQQNQMEE